MADQQVSNIEIEGAQIGFRNFSGKEAQYNPAGNRNFALFLDKPLATKLVADGWNVRWLKARDEDDPEDMKGLLQVKVGFGNYPPKIIVIQDGHQSSLNEETVHILDWAEIETVDLIIRPYSWAVQGKSGIKAYLKTMYVVLATDTFAKKYEALPDLDGDIINNECKEGMACWIDNEH